MTYNKNPSGIYEIKCNTCNLKYVGQSGRPITIRHKVYVRYIRSNNTTTAYAAHILNNRHEYGTAENTLKLIHKHPATSWVHYTTSCNTQSSAPEDGQNNFPKHVELTGIINKPFIIASSWLFILFISMMHGQANIR